MEEIKYTEHNGGVTEETIDGWKAKHRKVMEITVEDGTDRHKGYFHRPDMNTMSAVNKLSKTDEVKGSNTLFDNCWLGGSKEMQEDAVIKMSAMTQLSNIFISCTSELKNL